MTWTEGFEIGESPSELLKLWGTGSIVAADAEFRAGDRFGRSLYGGAGCTIVAEALAPTTFLSSDEVTLSVCVLPSTPAGVYDLVTRISTGEVDLTKAKIQLVVEASGTHYYRVYNADTLTEVASTQNSNYPDSPNNGLVWDTLLITFSGTVVRILRPAQNDVVANVGTIPDEFPTRPAKISCGPFLIDHIALSLSNYEKDERPIVESLLTYEDIDEPVLGGEIPMAPAVASESLASQLNNLDDSKYAKASAVFDRALVKLTAPSYLQRLLPYAPLYESSFRLTIRTQLEATTPASRVRIEAALTSFDFNVTSTSWQTHLSLNKLLSAGADSIPKELRIQRINP